jgi:hypothetical protein
MYSCVYVETAVGFGLMHSQDLQQATDAIKRGLWVPQEVLAEDLQARFGYVHNPQSEHDLLLKK